MIPRDPSEVPIPIRLHCPECHALHIDEGAFAKKPHHTHACQNCGHVWRPAIVPTVGVRFLPGFRNDARLLPGCACPPDDPGRCSPTWTRCNERVAFLSSERGRT